MSKHTLQTNPYQQRSARSFWQTGVAGRSGAELTGLFQPGIPLGANTAIATFGSCFARQIGGRLAGRGWAWVNAEPAPAFAPNDIAEAFGYGHFSARTGNIYTTAALVQWLGWAAGAPVPDEVWPLGERFFDPFRGEIEPGGFDTTKALHQSRATTIMAFLRAIEQADVFLFTLGLTEYWSNVESGAVYQLCPGTRAGRFDATVHRFNQARVCGVLAELETARQLLREINPTLHLILSVSPVAPSATMTDAHILTAASHTKSVLRAAAGEFAASNPGVDYFPGFELVTGALAGAARFAPGQRHVADNAVDMVMAHFFAGADTAAPPPEATAIHDRAQNDEDDACDEVYYSAFAPDTP